LETLWPLIFSREISDEHQIRRFGREEELSDVLETVARGELLREFPSKDQIPQKRSNACNREWKRELGKKQDSESRKKKKELQQQEALIAAKK